MKLSRIPLGYLILGLVLPGLARAQQTDTNAPLRLFGGALGRLMQIVEPSTNETPRTFTTILKLTKTTGLPKELAGQELSLAFQAPDHLRLSAKWDNQEYIVGRDRQELWVNVPGKKFGLLGSGDVPLFTAEPDRKDTTALGPIRFPVPSPQILMLPFVTDLTALPDEVVGGTTCRVLRATAKAEVVRGFGLPKGTLQLWVRASDLFPLRVGYQDGKTTDVQVELSNPQFSDSWPAEKWKLTAADGEKVESVARSHLTRFLSVVLGLMSDQVPTLGSETGERKVLAREGNGRLETIDGTRVLVLKGTPEEMGRQQGVLLKKEIHDLVNHILYGGGCGQLV